jgi:nitrogen fixation-related uncharacterized protein
MSKKWLILAISIIMGFIILGGLYYFNKTKTGRYPKNLTLSPCIPTM